MFRIWILDIVYLIHAWSEGPFEVGRWYCGLTLNVFPTCLVSVRAMNRFDPNDEFDEWAKPSRPLSKEAEQILGVTNEHLAHCRSSAAVMNDFELFLGVSINK